MPLRVAQWRRRGGVSPSTAAFVVVIVIMISLIAYATSVAGEIVSGPCMISQGPDSSSSGIKIGFLTELTGSSVSFGYAARIAAELAVNETNSAGGVGGRPIDLVFGDSQSFPQVATRCASALDQQGVLAITGTTNLGDALAVEGYAESNSVPFVVSAVSSGQLTPPGHSWTVSVQPDAVQWGAAVAKYVSEAVPSPKIALMTQNAPQQKEMTAGVRWYADTFRNETIVFDQVYANAQFAWATAAAAAKLSGANVVVLSWLPTVGFSESNVFQALLTAGFLPSQIFVADATDQISDLGTNGEGVRGVTVFDGAMASGNPNASSFFNELQPFVNGELQSNEYCGVCPTEVGPVYYYTYLGMEMMIKSIQSIVSSGQPLTRASFESAIRQATIQDAFGGALSFTPSGASIGQYYAVQVGKLNSTTNMYPFSIVKSFRFEPGSVPAYRLAKSG